MVEGLTCFRVDIRQIIKEIHGLGVQTVDFLVCYEIVGYFLEETGTPLLKKILEEPSIGKAAHNLKFEDVWASIILEVKIQNWKLCTMNLAHIFDNRSLITSLDYQMYLK